MAHSDLRFFRFFFDKFELKHPGDFCSAKQKSRDTKTITKEFAKIQEKRPRTTLKEGQTVTFGLD